MVDTLAIDESFAHLHGQAHIFNVVPKQPLGVSQKENVQAWARLTPPEPPVTTKEWEGPDPLGGHAVSKTLISCEISIKCSGESMTVPMWTAATAFDMRSHLEHKLGLREGSIRFFAKYGCNVRTFNDCDQLPRKVFVRGITNFKRQPEKHEHPYVIIGAGHCGLRTGMLLLERNDSNFIIVDRMREVGGTSWWLQANPTSKLQTEFGAYHLDWGTDTEIPQYFTTPWPSRNDLLKMFIDITDKYGLRPNCRLSTEVSSLEVINKPPEMIKLVAPCLKSDHYMLTLKQTDGETGRPTWTWSKADKTRYHGKDEQLKAQSVAMFPGNLTLPRRETYVGEDDFDGQIVYAIFSSANYSDCRGANVCVVGHGAFAVENVRTCCEFQAKQIYLLCRRKNISVPRVVSWLANRSVAPVSASLYLRSMKPMYDLLGYSVFTNYAVQAQGRVVSIQQKARFGIGDIYFLAGYFGKMEVIVDPGPVKRVTHHQVHLTSGRKLDCTVILKLLGFIGESAVDDLMKVKELTGYWVNDDPKRYLVAEPISVMAQNFSSTSFSPGALMWAILGVHFFQWPGDYMAVMDSNMMPRHKADDSDADTYRPAYVIDARHGGTTHAAVPMIVPQIAEDLAITSWCKPIKQRLCHPVKQFVEEAKADWDHYCRQFIAEGYDKPYPEFPYTPELTRALVILHYKESGEVVLPSDIEDLDILPTDVGADMKLKQNVYSKYHDLWERFADSYAPQAFV